MSLVSLAAMATYANLNKQTKNKFPTLFDAAAVIKSRLGLSTEVIEQNKDMQVYQAEDQ